MLDIANPMPVYRPCVSDAFQLLHEGSLVMSEMEANGLRVDTEYLKQAQDELKNEIVRLTGLVKSHPIFNRWRKRYGHKMKLSARAQLANILFNEMKIPYPGDEGSKMQGDQDILDQVDDDLATPFLEWYLELERCKKAKNTYLRNIEFETINGICHPNFNLHLARTYRGSSDHPNFTNMPIRQPTMKRIIRRCFRARPGHRIVDLDFKGSEVNAAAWYHKDPTMMDYIETDPGRMHFDAACQVYLLPPEQMTDEIRYNGKNKFVFPQFYGDWYLSCARQLWRAIDRQHLQTKSGMPLKKWLGKHGITGLGACVPGEDPIPGTFEAHVKEVEYDWWYNRFPVYSEWKQTWWDLYQERGWMQMLSGFIVSGVLNRKNAINYPIQGTAFHCLLWCLIRISRLLKKYRMKSMLVGQIHDDAVGDVPDRELRNYIDITQQVITVDLKRHWPWIVTPMRVDVEVTPIGGTWYEKSKWKA